MTKRLQAVLRLSRYQEFVSFVVVTTLLGAIAGGGRFGWRLLWVLAANWLAVGFAFMINDVEDAPDDALTPSKARRNPICSGDLSPWAGRWACLAVAAGSAVCYALVGLRPLALGLTCLLLGLLYSWRRVRFKTMPVLDLLSHCMLLAGLQFLAALFAFNPAYSSAWVYPFAALVAISMYGELFNELRDREGDLKAGLTHTANLLGPTLSHGLMIAFLVTGVVAGAVTVAATGLVPAWILLATLLMALPFVALRLRRRRTRGSMSVQSAFQKPLEIAGAASLLAWLAWPRLAPHVAPLLQWLELWRRLL